jgi:hypothetical protein
MIAIPRQGLAAIAATAALGLASFPATAPAALPIPPLPLPLPLPTIPALPPLPTDPAQVLSTLALLGIDTPEEIAAALVAADPAQLTALIQALPPAQLQAALAALTPEQLETLKTTVVALAAQAGAPPEVVALAASLTGTPTTGSAGGGEGGGATAGGGTTGSPTTDGGGSAPTPNRAVRAAIKKLKLSKNRRSVTVTLHCPADVTCGVGLGGTLRGKAAFKTQFVGVASHTTSATKIKLARKAAKRLRRKGGRLSVVAGTLGSTLTPVTKTVKAKKPKH